MIDLANIRLVDIFALNAGLFRDGKTDKIVHDYAFLYEELLSQWRDKPCRIMEIGVHGGGSIRAWEQAFPKAIVVGVDIKLSDVAKANHRETTVLVQADASSAADLQRICEENGPFHFVIDDAAHEVQCSRNIISTVFPQHLVPGGWLFIEDIHTHYWLDRSRGMIDLAKGLVDAVNHHGRMRKAGRNYWFESRTEFDREIGQLVFRPGIVGIQRHKP